MRILTNAVLWFSCLPSGRQEAMEMLRMIEGEECGELDFSSSLCWNPESNAGTAFLRKDRGKHWRPWDNGVSAQHYTGGLAVPSFWSTALLGSCYFWDCKMGFKLCSNKFLPKKKSITVFSYSQLLNFGLNIIWTSRIFLSFLFPPQGSLCKFHLLLLDGWGNISVRSFDKILPGNFELTEQRK